MASCVRDRKGQRRIFIFILSLYLYISSTSLSCTRFPVLYWDVCTHMYNILQILSHCAITYMFLVCTRMYVPRQSQHLSTFPLHSIKSIEQERRDARLIVEFLCSLLETSRMARNQKKGIRTIPSQDQLEMPTALLWEIQDSVSLRFIE